ncbi:MAG: hypothetical protein J6C65_04640 [Prevotella sp.]|nr:hypothetical protein [Prevotella sp.]
MKEIIGLIFIILTVFPNLAYSQKQIILQDMRNGEPVQYANIYTGNAVYYSDKDGKIELPDTISSFKVSHICFTDTMVVIPIANHNIVLMSPKTYDIPEITVINRKSDRLQPVGPFNKKERMYFGGRSGMLLSVYIPYQEKYGNNHIHGLVADLYDRNVLVRGSYDKTENTKLRFDLRLPAPQTNTPSSNSLIGGGIIYEGKSNGRKNIYLDHPVAFPHTGVFVILEWIVEGQCMDNVIYNPHVRMSKSDLKSITWMKREYRQENYWVNWDANAGMRQSQTSMRLKSVNANIGILISEK